MNTETKILTPFDAKQWRMKVQERAQAQQSLEQSLPSVSEVIPQAAAQIQKSEVILFDTNRLKTVRAALAALHQELMLPQSSSSPAA